MCVASESLKCTCSLTVDKRVQTYSTPKICIQLRVQLSKCKQLSSCPSVCTLPEMSFASYILVEVSCYAQQPALFAQQSALYAQQPALYAQQPALYMYA